MDSCSRKSRPHICQRLLSRSFPSRSGVLMRHSNLRKARSLRASGPRRPRGPPSEPGSVRRQRVNPPFFSCCCFPALVVQHCCLLTFDVAQPRVCRCERIYNIEGDDLLVSNVGYFSVQMCLRSSCLCNGMCVDIAFSGTLITQTALVFVLPMARTGQKGTSRAGSSAISVTSLPTAISGIQIFDGSRARFSSTHGPGLS